MAQVKLPLDRKTGNSKGIAFVTFSASEQAKAALEDTDGCIFEGRILHVMPAVDPPESETAKFSARKEVVPTAKKGSDQTLSSLHLNVCQTHVGIAQTDGEF